MNDEMENEAAEAMSPEAQDALTSEQSSFTVATLEAQVQYLLGRVSELTVELADGRRGCTKGCFD